MKITIGIIGLGTIGKAVLSALKKNQPFIKAKTGVDIVLKRVCDRRISLKKLVAGTPVSFSADPAKILNDPQINVVVELVGGVHPAKEYIMQALAHTKHVVTANKAVLASHAQEIFLKAQQHNRAIGFEASVAGGIPLMKNIVQGLSGARVKEIYGILNGTTNYVLDRMSSEKAEFKSALAQAQKAGYAERNPDLDVKGYDSLHKIAVLSYVCFGRWVNPQEEKIYVEGIDKISALDIAYAGELGLVIKLLSIAKQNDHTLSIRVHPALIAKDHLLSSVHGVYNAVHIKTDLNGELTFYGLGAGGEPTASAVISDLVDIAKKNYYFRDVLNLERSQKPGLKLEDIEQLQSSYYIRFTAKDKPGVLARISTILAEHSISIASVTQKQRSKGAFVPIVMITHEAKESSVRSALEKIDRLRLVKPKSQVIRIEKL